MKIKFLETYLIIFLFCLITATNLVVTAEQQFVALAKSFLEGRLDLVNLKNAADTAFYANRHYWPLGPLPAVVLMPLVFLFKNFHQGLLQIFLNIANFYLVFKICKKVNLDTEKSKLMAIFFIFGSTYTFVGAIPFSWYFAQVMATTILLLAVLATLNKKRPILNGALTSLAILTRFSLTFTIPFFLKDIIAKKKSKNLALFFFPVVLAITLNFAYNYYRFGSVLESGYSYQLIPEESERRRAFGLFSPVHIPANIYYMLLKTPDPVLVDNSHIFKPPYFLYDPYGLSILIMSPVLFLLFKTSFKDPYVTRGLITVAVLLIPITTYYGIGYIQVGYRYALDFFPFLIFPLASAFKRTSTNVIRILVYLGVFISWFFIFEKLVGF